MVESSPWKLSYTKQALKDAKKLSNAGLKNQAFWQDVAIIGGIIYLIGADVARPQVQAKEDLKASGKGKPKRD